MVGPEESHFRWRWGYRHRFVILVIYSVYNLNESCRQVHRSESQIGVPGVTSLRRSDRVLSPRPDELTPRVHPVKDWHSDLDRDPEETRGPRRRQGEQVLHRYSNQDEKEWPYNVSTGITREYDLIIFDMCIDYITVQVASRFGPNLLTSVGLNGAQEGEHSGLRGRP